MKIAVPSRHGRLLALCGLSAALHLLVLDLLARHGAGEPAPLPGAAGPLVLRLAPPAASRSAPAPAAVAAAAAPPAAAPVAAPAPPPAAKVAAASTPSPDAGAALPAAPASAPPADAAPAPAPAPGANASANADPGGAPSPGATELQAVMRYRVRMPPPVRLEYTLTPRDAAGRAGAPRAAYIDWRQQDSRYTLEMDGVLGRLSSSGVDGDAGIQPQRFTERRGNALLAAGFDPDAHRVVFADGATAPDATGIQDRASLLMQLAGIGLARPGQVQDVLEIAVAVDGATRIERYQVMGQEEVDTAAGPLPAWRLAQLAAPGQARLEVWLAPARGWLPVQLRLTAPGGASATQVLARAVAAHD